MLKTVEKLLSKVFTQKSAYQSDLEQFIVSKNPQSAAEVEHWTRIYDRRHMSSGRFYAS
jgi:Holliday junction resolvasome RuvABC endonuclease subunit